MPAQRWVLLADSAGDADAVESGWPRGAVAGYLPLLLLLLLLLLPLTPCSISAAHPALLPCCRRAQRRCAGPALPRVAANLRCDPCRYLHGPADRSCLLRSVLRRSMQLSLHGGAGTVGGSSRPHRAVKRQRGEG